MSLEQLNIKKEGILKTIEQIQTQRNTVQLNIINLKKAIETNQKILENEEIGIHELTGIVKFLNQDLQRIQKQISEFGDTESPKDE